MKLLSRVRLLATPWTAAYQALPSMGFSRQEYWSGVPLPSPSITDSILLHSAFFIVHLSHPYITTGKTIALTRWTFVGKVKSLLFNTLSRLEKAMAPHSSTLAWKIPWMEEPGRLQSMGSLKTE